MNAPISDFMGAALGTPETSQPAPSGHPDMDKPHAYEFGRMDHEGRFKVVIEHRYPTHAKSDWPIVPLFRRPAPTPVARDWKAVEAAIDDYLDGYELRLDEGCHTPTDFERLLIADAIAGMLAEDEILALLAARPATRAGNAPTAAAPETERGKRASNSPGSHESQDGNSDSSQ